MTDILLPLSAILHLSNERLFKVELPGGIDWNFNSIYVLLLILHNAIVFSWVPCDWIESRNIYIFV